MTGPNRGRSVVLASNIAHYHYLAAALDNAGLLQRYVTVLSPVGDASISAWIPQFIRQKLEGRRIDGICHSRVRQIYSAEVLQKLLPRLGVSADRANSINNSIFDTRASQSIADCRVFHFVSSIGLRSAVRAKQRNAIVVCDVRQEHPRFQRRTLEEEAAIWGVKSHVPGSCFEQRVLDEFALADYIVVPSVHAKRSFLAEGFTSDRIVQLPYGVDTSMFRPLQIARRERFSVLYVGSVNLRKGVLYLLEAFREWKRKDAELIIAGPVDPTFAPMLARYEGTFRYLPPLPKADLYKLYAQGSVFVLPSLADSFSLATLEAMACGLPVIVSENTGVADNIDDGVNGFVVPIRDVNAICQRLQHLAEDPNRVDSIGNAATEAAARMTWDHYGMRAVELYRSRFLAA